MPSPFTHPTKGKNMSENPTNPLLTYDEAVTAAREIVAERGEDFIYNPNGIGRCAYVPLTDSRSPYASNLAAQGAAVTGCLVGEIISRTGRMTDDIAANRTNVSGLISEGLLRTDGYRTRTFLAELQQCQDTGRSWGQALTLALEQASRVTD